MTPLETFVSRAAYFDKYFKNSYMFRISEKYRKYLEDFIRTTLIAVLKALVEEIGEEDTRFSPDNDEWNMTNIGINRERARNRHSIEGLITSLEHMQ